MIPSKATEAPTPLSGLSAMLTLNIQGMTPGPSSKSYWKLPYLQELVNECPDFVPFISITETWAKSYNTDSQMEIKGYNIFRADRKLRKRGGAALYVHNSIHVDEFWKYDDRFCEAGVALLKSSKTIIAVIYRSQKASLSSFTDALQFVENKIKSLDDTYTIIITGDFNLPNICWDTLTVQTGLTTAVSDAARRLLQFMEIFLLNQEVNIPTRENNILDLFLTNRHDLVLDILSTKSSISDHNLLKIPLSYSFGSDLPKCDLQKSPFNEGTFRCLDFSKANFDLLSSLFNACDWDGLLNFSPSNFAAKFHEKILSICLQNVPKKTIFNQEKKRKNHGNNARKKRGILSRLFALKEHNPTSPNIALLESKLLQYEDRRKSQIYQSKLRKELCAIQNIKKNPNHFYKYAKKFAKSKSRIGPLKHPCGGVTSDPQSMTTSIFVSV